jgi:hypothetical protein
VIVGGVGSSVHVAVLDVVEVFPQISVAVKVLVWDLEHPVLDMLLFETVIVGAPHASVAVAVPNAALIADDTGLQPNVSGLPVALMKGDV